MSWEIGKNYPTARGALAYCCGRTKHGKPIFIHYGGGIEAHRENGESYTARSMDVLKEAPKKSGADVAWEKRGWVIDDSNKCYGDYCAGYADAIAAAKLQFPNSLVVCNGPAAQELIDRVA